MYSYKDLIDQAEQNEAERQECQRKEERERKRFRSLQEAQAIISSWKKEHKRKKKTRVSISILWNFDLELNRSFYFLRLFVGGDLVEIYNLEESAGKELTIGIREVIQGGYSFFNIYNNIKS